VKRTFSRADFFGAFLCGFAIGALVLFQVWLLVGEPRV
jgi:hypothetical protein